MSTAATRGCCKRPRPAPTISSATPTPTAFRRGTSTRPANRRKLLDTSAAAIAAAALLRLHDLLQDPIKGHFYASTAMHILRTLCEKHLARNAKKWEGILKGGVYHVHKELGVDETVMWGEYFFVEALDQALRQL